MAELPASISDTEAKKHRQKRDSQKTAPSYLVNYCNAANWSKGKQELRSLLDDPSMTKVWKRLGTKFKTDAEWKRLWQEILYALQKANQVAQAVKRGIALETRDEIDKGLKSIAADARSLTRKLDAYQLDILAFYCCPPDFVKDENNFVGPFAWLSVKDILDGLARVAETRDADTGRMTGKHKMEHARETEFSMRLYEYLKSMLTDKSDNIFATIAVIGVVAMGSSTITPDTVKSSCRIRSVVS